MLEYFYEGDLPIVEYGGNFYWVGKEDPPEGIVLEDAEAELSDVPAIRRSIGVESLQSIPYDSEPEGEYDGGRFLDEDGYLPDKDIKLYKKVINKVSFQVDSQQSGYLVYHLGEKAWFCIRQGCEDCTHLDICQVELVEKPARMLMINIDVSSQEPMLNTLLSKEPRWLETFRNRHLRELGLTKYVDIIAEEYFGINVDLISSHWYWTWLDKNFHRDFTKLIEFNAKVDQFRQGIISEMDSDISEMLESMKEFKS